MGKGQVGREASTIAKLRKDLADQIDENKLLRPLIIENAHLEQQSKIYRKFLGDDDTKQAAREISLARAQPGLAQITRHGRAQATPASEPTDQCDTESTAIFHGKKYTYRNGELLPQMANEKPRYMEATAATKSKQKAQNSSFMHWGPLLSFSPGGNWDSEWEAEIGNRPVARRALLWRQNQESAEWEPSPSRPSNPRSPSPVPTGYGDDWPTRDLAEGPREMYIHSKTGLKLLKGALKLIRECFYEVAKANWPAVYDYMWEGPHLVKLDRTEMEAYLDIISKPLDEITPDPALLTEKLLGHIPNLRNTVAHPSQPEFGHCSKLEAHLYHAKIALLLMGDADRAKKVEELRCELRAEAQRTYLEFLAYEDVAEMPFHGLDQEGIEVELAPAKESHK